MGRKLVLQVGQLLGDFDGNGVNIYLSKNKGIYATLKDKALISEWIGLLGTKIIDLENEESSELKILEELGLAVVLDNNNVKDSKLEVLSLKGKTNGFGLGLSKNDGEAIMGLMDEKITVSQVAYSIWMLLTTCDDNNLRTAFESISKNYIEKEDNDKIFFIFLNSIIELATKGLITLY